MRDKKFITSVILIILIGCYFLFYKPYRQAVNQFNNASQLVQQENKELENTIKKANKSIEKNEKPLEKDTLKQLEKSVTKAEKKKRKIPKIKLRTSDINKQAANLSKDLDYTSEKEEIETNLKNYQTSVVQRKQITNPNQSFIEQRLGEISAINEIKAATEETDVNNLLHKQGGYTAAVYFTSDLVVDEVPGEDPVTKGTDGGGNIEVFKNEQEAEKRNNYLAAFDGQGIMDPGGHYLYGTVIIRTSRFLTATQQKELTNQIYQKLIEIKESHQKSKVTDKSKKTDKEEKKSTADSATQATENSQQNQNSSQEQTSPSSQANTAPSTASNHSDDEMTDEELNASIQALQDSRAYYAPNEYENYQTPPAETPDYSEPAPESPDDSSY